MKLSQAPRGQRQSVLIFGPPKTGKTKLAGALAETMEVIYIGMENGHATLQQLPVEWQERIELVNIPDTRSYPIAIESALKIVKGAPVTICEEHGKVDCAICKKNNAPVINLHLNALGPNAVVIYDSLTQLTNSAIAHITKGKPDDYKLEYDDWGNLGKLMDVFLSHIQQAKYNVICISHETEVEMEDGKMRIVPTAGTRNFSRNTAKYFGHVVYAEVKNLKHKFTSGTTATVNIVTGSRTDVLLEKMNEPSLASIFTNDRLAPTKTSDSRDKQDTGNVETKTNGEVAASRLTGLAATLAAKRSETAGGK